MPRKGKKIKNREQGSTIIKKPAVPWTAVSGTGHQGCRTGKPRLRDEAPALDGDRGVGFADDDDGKPLDQIFK